MWRGLVVFRAQREDFRQSLYVVLAFMLGREDEWVMSLCVELEGVGLHIFALIY